MEIVCVESTKIFLQGKEQKIHNHTYRNKLLEFVTLISVPSC